MAAFMKESGKMIKLMGRESTRTKTGLYTKENSLMIYKKEMELKLGQMGVSTQVLLWEVRKKEMEYSTLQMALYMWEVFIWERWRGQVRKLGRTALFLKGPGWIIKWKEKAPTIGQTAEITRVIG